MKQIKIGTCVPGAKAEEWLKGFIGKGFETFSLNFHMSLEGTDLDKLALSTEKLLAGTDSKITTVGYYCNPIQYADHRKTLEKVICTAEKFGATHVSTFAGCLLYTSFVLPHSVEEGSVAVSIPPDASVQPVIETNSQKKTKLQFRKKDLGI